MRFWPAIKCLILKSQDGDGEWPSETQVSSLLSLEMSMMPMAGRDGALVRETGRGCSSDKTENSGFRDGTENTYDGTSTT